MFRSWCLTLAVAIAVSGERLKEHQMKSGLCTTDVNQRKGVCYMYNSRGKDQPAALAACEVKGGTLAALDTAETYNFVQTAMSASKTGYFWIGYNEDSDMWYDGSPFNWTNYYPGEPNRASEKCLLIMTNYNFTFADSDCEHSHRSLCQLPVHDTQAHAIVKGNTVGTMSLPRSEWIAESKFRCGQYCLQDPLCGKFNFHRSTLKCALYDMGAVVKEVNGSQTFTF